MKTEQLKIIAEAQNIKVVGGLDIPVTEFKEFYYAEKLYYYDGRWIEWNPETNAEQTLMVLKWWFDVAELANWNDLYWEIERYGFQTTVCIAALAYVDHVN